MEKEKHVVEGSTQKNLALDPEKQKEFKKNNKEIKSKVVFVIYGKKLFLTFTPFYMKPVTSVTMLDYE